MTSAVVEMKTGSDVHFYHPKCFACKKCGAALRQGQVDQHAGLPYCLKCVLIVNPKHAVKAAIKDMGFRFG